MGDARFGKHTRVLHASAQFGVCQRNACQTNIQTGIMSSLSRDMQAAQSIIFSINRNLRSHPSLARAHAPRVRGKLATAGLSQLIVHDVFLIFQLDHSNNLAGWRHCRLPGRTDAAGAAARARAGVDADAGASAGAGAAGGCSCCGASPAAFGAGASFRQKPFCKYETLPREGS